jgi:hypothetical protein
MNNTVKAIILMLVVALITCGIAYAVFTLTIPSQGNISGTANISASPATIDWGTIAQGSTTPIARSVTITNTGGQPTASLTMTATTSIGVVTWDLETQTIAAGSSKVATITLTPDAAAPVGPFSFNIAITG